MQPDRCDAPAPPAPLFLGTPTPGTGKFHRLAIAALAIWAGTLPAEVVINEIHYDPTPKHDLVEFIELVNSGEDAVDLSGWRFTRGIDYTFPDNAVLDSGAYLVLAQSKADYDRKFGSVFVAGVPAYAQWHDGRLSNQGDTLVLEDAAGAVRDEVDYRVGFPWPVAPNNDVGVSMELLHPALDNELGSSWRPARSNPTPGLRNSVHTEGAPPNIRQVSHAPRSPRSGEAVVVTAKISDPDGVATVELDYQVVRPGAYLRLTDADYETAWDTLPMNDEGRDGDAVAGDAVYSATLTGSEQKHRHLYRYRIRFRDTQGNADRAPFADDPTPNFAWFCYDAIPSWTGAVEPGETSPMVFGRDLLESLPIYHLISREEDVLDCQYNSAFNNKVYRFLGTLVYDGEVYDHMRYRIRGHGSTYNTGKNKWKWRFNRGRLFQGRDNFGAEYPEPVDTLNISAMASPWNPANRGMCGLDEALSYRLWEMAGVPAPRTNYFHFRVIDAAAESNAGDQYEGDLWGLYLAIEQFDGRALRSRDLPDGNVYNMHFGNTNYLNEGLGQPTDRSDLDAFVHTRTGYNKTNPIQPVEWWRDNVELDAYYRYRAVWEAVNHSDQRDQENSIYYHNPETGRWSIHPWDNDLLYEEFDRWGPDAVQTTVPFEQFRKCLQHNEIRIEFQNRIREMQDLLLNRDQLWHLVDEFAGFIESRGEAGDAIPLVSLERSGVEIVVTTAAPHGLAAGETVFLKGASPASYSGEKTVEAVLSETRFSFKGSIFAPAPDPPGPETVLSREPDPVGWWQLDQARWDHHPRSRAVEGPSTATGSYYVNPFRYTRFSGKVRTLTSADFPGMIRWVKDFTVPPGFGGAQLQALAEDPNIPDTPSIRYTGPEGYPLDGLTFETDEFSGGTIFVSQRFESMAWRVGEILNPTTPGYNRSRPMIFEIDPVWESGEIGAYAPGVQVPLSALRPDTTYRARVRFKNQLGHWSHWSEPHEFRTSEPEALRLFRESLVISEFMYHPGEVSEQERAAGFEESDFEFIELWNAGAEALDLSSLRFTKGIDFDFAGAQTAMLPAGGRVLVTRNAAAFAMRYGAGLPVIGAWGDDRLDNGGERLKLSYGAGIAVIDFAYDDRLPWPPEADGDGPSLEWKGIPGTGQEDPGAWVASNASGGSPGVGPSPAGSLSWASVEFMPGGAGVTLRWESEPGAVYQAQESSDLIRWKDIGAEVEADSTESEITIEREALETRTRFLRVRR